MDPGTIVGVASAAIAFLDFAIELVKGTHEIYSSLNGSSDANAHVDLVISDLHTASGTLIVQNTTARTGLASQHEKALAELSAKCHRKCIELLNVTKKLKIHDRSKWSSFNAAWKLHWKKDDIDHMHGELRDYRLAILLRLNQMQMYVATSSYLEWKKTNPQPLERMPFRQMKNLTPFCSSLGARSETSTKSKLPYVLVSSISFILSRYIAVKMISVNQEKALAVGSHMRVWTIEKNRILSFRGGSPTTSVKLVLTQGPNTWHGSAPEHRHFRIHGQLL